ncbi:hypothetical protein [Polaromonas sp.]|uniref:hypothetical protein n=1 Tax=Polaromonas sp. TaxID=1869339 RepID=UPI00352A747E
MAENTSMQENISDLLRSYHADFSQQVRELAETFCFHTTRLGQAPPEAPHELTEEFRFRAKAHGVSEPDLKAAVARYVRIEALAESAYRLNGPASAAS